MPKKSASPNGFYYFMLDWKARAQTQGRKFSSLKEVQEDPALSIAWKNLPLAEKENYQRKANNANVGKKKTTLGDDIDLVEKKERDKQLFISSMIETISQTVQLGLKENNLHKQHFYFIHTNYFFVRELDNREIEYFPAEFAVAKYSVEEGISEVYHEIVSSKIPLGFAREAREISTLTHKIPYDFPQGQKDYNYMYNKLLKFLSHNNGHKLPPLYTTKENSAVVLSLLNKMMNAARVDLNTFVIYSVEHLFSSMHSSLIQQCCDTNVPSVVIENEFLNNTFAHTSGIECAFHKIIDGTSQYCSMAIVKQWGFILCDYCCQYLNVPMIKGIHCPNSERNIDPTHSLNDSFSHLNLKDLPRNEVRSMTGVSASHALKVSERTKDEIERSRKNQKPVSVIDHGKLNEEKATTYKPPSPVLYERPLRAPKTTSFAALAARQTDTPELNEINFPKIVGRGMSIRSQERECKPPLGRGKSLKQQ